MVDVEVDVDVVVEPVGQAFVNLESVTDMFPWKHALPKEQK